MVLWKGRVRVGIYKNGLELIIWKYSNFLFHCIDAYLMLLPSASAADWYQDDNDRAFVSLIPIECKDAAQLGCITTSVPTSHWLKLLSKCSLCHTVVLIILWIDASVPATVVAQWEALYLIIVPALETNFYASQSFWAGQSLMGVAQFC